MSDNIFDTILSHAATTKKTEKQQKVFDSAIQLFAEKGYANTSTAEIARAAGVSEGTIFRHYGTKDRLLLSVIIPFLTELFPQMAEEIIDETMPKKETTFEQFLRSLLMNRIKFATENKEVFQILIKELMYNDELKEALLPFAINKLPPKFIDILEGFKARGELIDLPVERIIKILVNFVGGFFVIRYLLISEDSISAEEVEDAIQFILKGLRNPLNDV